MTRYDCLKPLIILQEYIIKKIYLDDFYRIAPYESVYLYDSDNDPPGRL